MRTTDVQMILQTYKDAENKRKAILSLSKLLDVSTDEIVEKLQQNGVQISYAAPKKKPIKDLQEIVKENPIQSVAPEAAALPMPEYVQDILFREFGSLERKMDELAAELEVTKEHYAVLKQYLFES